MKILSWNCRGLGNNDAVTALKKLFQTYRADFAFLCETKLDAHEFELIRRQSGFQFSFVFPCEDRRGGLALLWNDDSRVVINDSNRYFIDTNVDHELFGRFRLTGFYGESKTHLRDASWDALNNLNRLTHEPWLVCGDFNEILYDSEKIGGNPRALSQMEKFSDTIESCNLRDMGCIGPWFTWTNNQEEQTHIRERLDRMLATSEWYQAFPFAEVENIAWIESDHSPILLDAEDKASNSSGGRKGRFMFEASWAKDEACKQVIWRAWSDSTELDFNKRLELVAKELSLWHKINIGELNRRIKQLQKQLTAAQKLPPLAHILEEERNIEKKLHTALLEEERYWYQRSRVQWLAEGDKNTKYYHARASARRKKNKITKLRDQNNSMVEDEISIKRVAEQYFKDIFSSHSRPAMDPILEVIQPRITEAMNQKLLRDFTDKEIERAVKQMHPNKSPGPDGMPPLFYQQFWDIVGKDAIATCLGLLRGTLDMEKFNESLIALIPKIDDPLYMQHFRLISLCNVIYKVVSKVLVNHMKPMLVNCIGGNQSAFVKGRQITDNIIVAYEMIHNLHTRKKGKENHFALKLDMSKAFDRVEWDFIFGIMGKLGFAPRWIQSISSCVESVSYSILINGQPTEKSCPSRGLRQGDPLSPFLFLMCAEGLSGLITHSTTHSDSLGMKIRSHSPLVSHLFFADDSIVFAKADHQGATALKTILTLYENISAQKVNYEKSCLFFSSNTSDETKAVVQQIFNIQLVTNPEKYLGLPTLVGKGRTRAFKDLVDRVKKKIQNWATKFLSSAGREVLIKSVLQAIPMYTMQCFLLPKKLCNDITKVIRHFWWKGNDTGKPFCAVSWKSLCMPKALGGLGFRDLHAFNMALLAKQVWRLIHNPDTLCYKVLKSRYFPNSSVMEASLGHKPSFIWRSIWTSRKVLLKGSIWRIGNGKDVRVFHDNWLPLANNTKISSDISFLPIDTRVSELMIDNGTKWNIDLLNSAFPPFEAYAISTIPLYGDQVQDRLVWHPKPNGKYSVKSGYHCMLNENMEFGPHKRIWKSIWNAKVAGKVKICAWKICSDSLPTAAFLHHRTGLGSPICPRCQAPEEDALHALKLCPLSALTLERCNFSSHILQSTPLSAAAWVEEIALNTSHDEFNLFLSAIWLIWSSRNSHIHQGTRDSHIRLSDKILSYFQEYKDANVPTSPPSNPLNSSTHWKAPEGNTIKVNFDASFNLQSKSGAAGMVMRDSEGFVLGAASIFLPCVQSPAIAEAHAAYLALKTAKEMLFSEIIFEGDCLQVILSLQSDEVDLSEIGILVDLAKSEMLSFRSCNTSFSRRNTNIVAHQLAKNRPAFTEDMF